MIKFLFLGLIRDKSRSVVPVIVVATGVMLTVTMHAYIKGFMGDTIEMNAKFSNGHVKVMTGGYADNINQTPNDMALLGVSELIRDLENEFPEIDWTPRIQFGGLIDAPDENGETLSQGPALGMGIDLLGKESEEVERLNLRKSLVRGKMPEQSGEILISDLFASKLDVEPGDKVTLIGSTMNGSMAMYNFTIAGTVSFGNDILDRGAIIADIEDARIALDMPDAAGEIPGFFREGFYENESALAIAHKFNTEKVSADSLYSPVMKSLSQQGSMGQYVRMSEYWANYIAMVFIFAMSLVLWNAGLLGGLRRYGEVGLRLAMGEEKDHVYSTLIIESVMIGIIGSVAGTALGLFFSWLLQEYGINISKMMEGSSIMMPTVIRARITPADYYLGFIPGLISTVIGTMLSGTGIYKRQTAKLFKELEA